MFLSRLRLCLKSFLKQKKNIMVQTRQRIFVRTNQICRAEFDKYVCIVNSCKTNLHLFLQLRLRYCRRTYTYNNLSLFNTPTEKTEWCLVRGQGCQIFIQVRFIGPIGPTAGHLKLQKTTIFDASRRILYCKHIKSPNRWSRH